MSDFRNEDNGMIHLTKNEDGFEVKVAGDYATLVNMIANAMMKNEIFEEVVERAMREIQKRRANQNLN